MDISGRRVLIVTCALLIALPLLLYLGSHLLLETAYDHRVTKIRHDNKALKGLVNKFEDRIETLEREIYVLAEMDKDLRNHAKLPDIPEAIRQVGIGGTMAEVKTDMDYLLPSDDIALAEMTERLDALYRNLKLEQISYNDLKDAIKDDLADLQNIPSIRPVNVGYASSGYGMRRHPYTGQYQFHKGEDIRLKQGTEVRATADGTVVVAGQYDFNLGLYIKIKHSNGFQTVYGHLNDVSIIAGNAVKRGELIGHSGNSGRSTAPHLHYEVRHFSKAQNPRNYY